MSDKKRRTALNLGIFAILVVIFLLTLCFQVKAAGSGRTMEELIDNGAVLLEDQGRSLVSINPDMPFIPASIQKIATSLLALDILGEDFHFTTSLYLAENRLYVKGNGDPFLVSEEIERLAGMLVTKGITAIDSVVLDDGYFALETEEFYGQSNNPYDALNSALAVNFNTINLTKAQNGLVRSAEKQTPTLALMREQAAGLPPGTQRISLPRRQDLTIRYCGELFVAIFNQSGIRVKGGWQRGTLPEKATLVLAFQNEKSLPELLENMLLYSNNFMANQLFLACAARQLGQPATWAKARRVAEEYFASRGFSDKELHLQEGSGLSRKNRVTARAMLRLLDLFLPFRALLPEHEGVKVKSGTLHGVYCFAGYLTPNHLPRPFVIMLNQPKNTRNEILTRLKEILKR